MLWVLKRTVSLRRFFWVPTMYVLVEKLKTHNLIFNNTFLSCCLSIVLHLFPNYHYFPIFNSVANVKMTVHQSTVLVVKAVWGVGMTSLVAWYLNSTCWSLHWSLSVIERASAGRPVIIGWFRMVWCRGYRCLRLRAEVGAAELWWTLPEGLLYASKW